MSIIKSALIVLIVASLGCRQGNNKSINFPQNYPVLHPKFRMWPSPAMNNVSLFNPPSLLWPAVQKKGTVYDIRLSQDSAFETGETFHAGNIPWAMFNPHQKLANGTWYWQFKAEGSNWSKINRFRISEESSDLLAPPAEKFISSLSVEHPRVLLEKKNLDSFRNEVRLSPDAREIIRMADQYCSDRLPEESEGKVTLKSEDQYQKEKLAQNASLQFSNKIYGNIDTWCKAWVITGNEKYSGQAVRWALKVASWNPDGVTSLSDFGDSRCMVAMALVFDTFYDRLQPDEKSILLKAAGFRAERLYKTWANFIESRLLSAHVWQYMIHYFLETSLALYGHHDKAGEWISYVYEVWIARAPVMGETEGGWLEGASYFRLNIETLLDIPMIIKNHTGFDFIQKHPWYKNNPGWIIYSFPPGSSSDGFGDDTERIYEPGQEYLAWSDALSRLTVNNEVAWYSQRIASETGLKVTDCAMLRWFRLKYLRNSTLPEAGDAAKWPLAKVFYDIGIADLHSNLNSAENDLMVSFRSSPFGAYGHMLADQNTFNILAGGKRLFYHSGYKVAMDDPHRLLWYKHTRGHNGILIDGKGQPFDVEAYGWIARFINGRSLSYVVGDASMAYNSKAEKQQSGLTKFRRHILFLQPGTLVIYDDLEADHPAEWEWNIHSPQKIEIDSLNKRFTCKTEKFNAEVRQFASASFHWSLTDTFAIPVTNWTQRVDDEGNLVHYSNDQWHLTSVFPEKAPALRIITLINVSGDKIPEVTMLPEKDNRINTFKTGDWILRCELDISKPALLEAERNDGMVAFTSASDKITLGKKLFRGKLQGSSKLVEIIDDQPVMTESEDHFPEIIKNIPVKGKEKLSQ